MFFFSVNWGRGKTSRKISSDNKMFTQLERSLPKLHYQTLTAKHFMEKLTCVLNYAFENWKGLIPPIQTITGSNKREDLGGTKLPSTLFPGFHTWWKKSMNKQWTTSPRKKAGLDVHDIVGVSLKKGRPGCPLGLPQYIVCRYVMTWSSLDMIWHKPSLY